MEVEKCDYRYLTAQQFHKILINNQLCYQSTVFTFLKELQILWTQSVVENTVNEQSKRCFLKKNFRGGAGGLTGLEFSFLLWIILVPFLATTWQFTMLCTSSSWRSDDLFDLLKYQACTRCTYIHVSHTLK